ncbi:hypothetical protein CH380_19320 [Leptospira adleri]|uniref:Uncharacterized protein n=1 Tax=Leptospira adleri TaxID=2023186 RepID=A0A2M9YJ83_9LEPT|nr:hypothetical protein CH380_19320 [Leptospira adleri]PJZ61893.1 hypothetical protein CH376_10845 [Leptospira adleri]
MEISFQIDSLTSLQKLNPDFGYDAPTKIKNVRECKSPAFADHRYHRIGKFKKEYLTDGLRGWIVDFICVNCGIKDKHAFFPDSINRKESAVA